MSFSSVEHLSLARINGVVSYVAEAMGFFKYLLSGTCSISERESKQVASILCALLSEIDTNLGFPPSAAKTSIHSFHSAEAQDAGGDAEFIILVAVASVVDVAILLALFSRGNVVGDNDTAAVSSKIAGN